MKVHSGVKSVVAAVFLTAAICTPLSAVEISALDLEDSGASRFFESEREAQEFFGSLLYMSYDDGYADFVSLQESVQGAFNGPDKIKMLKEKFLAGEDASFACDIDSLGIVKSIEKLDENGSGYAAEIPVCNRGMSVERKPDGKTGVIKSSSETELVFESVNNVREVKSFMKSEPFTVTDTICAGSTVRRSETEFSTDFFENIMQFIDCNVQDFFDMGFADENLFGDKIKYMDVENTDEICFGVSIRRGDVGGKLIVSYRASFIGRIDEDYLDLMHSMVEALENYDFSALDSLPMKFSLSIKAYDDSGKKSFTISEANSILEFANLWNSPMSVKLQGAEAFKYLNE